MSNKFSSDYVPSQPTPAFPAAAQKAVETVATGGRPEVPAEGADPKAYGFEPGRYGLGKPRRVVIRGKIAIE